MSRSLVTILLSATLAAACHSGSATAPRDENGDELEVSTAPARLEEIPDALDAVGTLEPHERVILSAQIGGIVAEANVDFGDRVQKGQVLGGLDLREFALRVDAARAALKQTEAMLVKARQDHRRALQLHKEGALSDEDRDRAITELRVAEANHEAAATQLAIAEKHSRDARLISPVDGYVAVRRVNVGEYVAANTPVVEIVVVDPLKLRVAVPDRFVGRVTTGLPVTMEVDAFPGERFAGEVSRVGSDVDTKTRSFLVESAIPNSSGRLKPGQFARAVIDLGRQAAIVVPRAAVSTFGGTNRVFVVDGDGRVENRTVVPGRDLGESVAILEGLAAGETVATSHLERLADGARVRAVGRGPA